MGIYGMGAGLYNPQLDSATGSAVFAGAGVFWLDIYKVSDRSSL